MFSLAGVRYAALLAALAAVAGGEAFSHAEKVLPVTGCIGSLTTMTTVGYGDMTPTTTFGKVVTIIVMLVGIASVAVLTGAVAERFIAPQEEAIEFGERDLHAKLDQLQPNASTAWNHLWPMSGRRSGT